MFTTLGRDQVEQYERDGVLFPIPVLTADEVAGFRAAFDEVEAQSGGALKRLDNAHLFFRWAYRLATHPAVVDAVSAVLGDEVLIDGTLILCKYPRDTGYVSWHQDSVYSGWHLSPSTSAWIALSPSTAESGCMRVIPGSQARGLLDHVEMPDRDNMLRRGEQVGADVDESEAVDLVLRPGEMSLHHSNIIHGSNPNRSDARRVGFIVRFVTSRSGDRETPLVRVRGTSDGRHLNLATEPAESGPAEGLAAWEAFNRRRRVNA